MAISIVKIPDVGEGVAEVELVEWNVKVGDRIREDDVIAAVMTDKATVEIPSLYDGIIRSLGGEIGEVLAVGSLLVTIEHEGESKDIAPPKAEADPAPPPVQPKAEPAAASKPTQAAGPQGEEPLASPALRARARAAGIDLRQLRGSGPAGRITDADLDAALAAGPTQPQSSRPNQTREGKEEIRVIGLRRKIADRMSLANAKIPHIALVEEIDVTAVEDLRGRMNDARGEKPKLTMLPFLSAALCRALLDHPEMNAHFDDEAGVITRHAPIHIGIATMTDNGLMVPVLRHAEALGIYGAGREIARLAEAARSGKALREELSGSTITISSLGPLGAIATTPIINAPEVAILGINKIAIRPLWDGNQFIPRKMMNISASFDHRVIDGLDAAKFIQRMKLLLETPALIFMEPEA